MEIQLILNGRTRREAAECVGRILRVRPQYMLTPSYAYSIGAATIDADGRLILDDEKTLQPVLTALCEAGFYIPETEGLVIQMPLEGFSELAFDNLQKLVNSKYALIKKAVGAENLTVVRNTETGTVDFSWISVDADPDLIKACTQLVAALCDMAKRQKRVTAVEKDVEDEKKAFRHFLLRLGFIGDEFALSRKIFMRNLDGCS